MLLGIGVFVSGAAGAVARYLVDGAVQERWRGAFPAGTFVINVSGALTLGGIAGFFTAHTSAPVDWKVLLGTGFIGAYTTFSTWMFESLRLLREGAPLYGLANLLGSIGVGLGAAWLGLAIGAKL